LDGDHGLETVEDAISSAEILGMVTAEMDAFVRSLR
jgi:hypothetical protein